MHLALVPFNPVIGRIEGNAEAILAHCREAAEAGADLVVFPELALVGYPPKDLLDRRDLLEANRKALARVAKETPIPALVGFVDVDDAAPGMRRYNAAAFLPGGGVAEPVTVVRKTHLPTYDVFDEARWFARGEPAPPIPVPVRAGGPPRRVGVSICEDIWPDPRGAEDRVSVLDAQAEAGAEVLVNLSASPYERGKPEVRRTLLSRAAREAGRPVVYVNAYGGNDELVFDGETIVCDGDGRCRFDRIFSEETAIVDLGDLPAPEPPAPPDWAALAVRAITLGVRDFFRKCGLERAVVGLSGGVDSAAVCCLAARALGGGNVQAIFLPSRHSSKESRRDAKAIAKAAGVEYDEVPIDGPVEALRSVLRPSLGEAIDAGVASENLQARTRGLILMAHANAAARSAVLGTGNKSELAVGYATLYGDLIGALLPIGDCTKTRLYEVVRRLADEMPAFPEELFTKPPTAELRPNQKDEDDLMPYADLDPIVEAFVEEGKTAEEIAAAGHDPEDVAQVLAWIEKSEFKRAQAPPVLKVTRRAFGPGWQIPIAAKRGKTAEAKRA